MLIPLRALPKLRIDWKKKLTLIAVFALGSFAIITAIVRCVLFVGNATVTKVFLWSVVEQVVCYLVANAPALRPLFFRESFQSRGSSLEPYNTRSQHEVYELTPGTMAQISVGKRHFVRHPTARAGDIVQVERTVKVTVHESESHEDLKMHGVEMGV
jgi:hypothetical protein